MSANGSLLLVLPVPFRQGHGGLLVERQAANGLDRWAAEFSRVGVACPLLPATMGDLGQAWVGESTIERRRQLSLYPLPWAYHPRECLQHYRTTRETLGKFIGDHRYLQFAIGGLFGDWASVAALEAHRQHRPYAVWTDRVEHRVVRNLSRQESLPRRLRGWLISEAMRHYENHVIRRAALGLFHGSDTYLSYRDLCPRSHLVHDIHVGPEQAIHPATLAEKKAQATGPLRIVYAGRMDAMKAPLDWLRALALARDQGVAFQATWLGDGALMADCQALRKSLGLEDRVTLPGFVDDHARVLNELSDAHLLLFTHITPESPRCLLEALIKGCPIVGYRSFYPEDLLAEHGGGMLTPLGDPQALADALLALDRDRAKLAALMDAAAANGQRFNDRVVFAHRAALIKQYLG